MQSFTRRDVLSYCVRIWVVLGSAVSAATIVADRAEGTAMSHRRTALVSAAALLFGAGLFGVSALPASGEPTASTDQRLAAGWAGIRVASMAEAEQRMDAEAGADGETLVFFSTETGEAIINIPPAAFGPGDFLLFEEQLYTDPARSQPAGVDSVRFELSISTLNAEATFRVAGGKIRIAATQFFDEAVPSFPITGGTGAYRDAGGVFIPFELPNGDTELIFRIVR